MTLKDLRAIIQVNSIGKLTLRVIASDGVNTVSAVVPGGNSKGVHEARVINPFKAVERVNKLRKKLINNDLELIDELISREAGNVSTGISIAVTKLMAKRRGISVYELLGGKRLPQPMMNIINGGVHAGNNLAFQEYMIIPRSTNITNSIIMGVEVFNALRDYLKKKYGAQAINVGFEGGFAPQLSNVEEPLKIITRVLKSIGYYEEVKLGIDAAASQFYQGKHYYINDKKFTTNQLIDYYEQLINEYNIVSIEDPFHEEDFQAFAELKRRTRIRIVGDDLTVTNEKRVSKAINEKSCNSLLVKINQVGTVSKAMKAISKARKDDWELIVSHRSGDSCDSFISDFAVGVNAEFIKSGAPNRGERVSKYNRLIMIEQELKSHRKQL